MTLRPLTPEDTSHYQPDNTALIQAVNAVLFRPWGKEEGKTGRRMSVDKYSEGEIEFIVSVYRANGWTVSDMYGALIFKFYQQAKSE